MGFDILGQIGAQGMCYIVEQLGYCYNIKWNKTDIYTIHISKRFRRFYPGEIKNIRVISEEGHENEVYDIETDNHTLNAGIGSTVVHNCDGLHISSLLQNMFHALFPTILEREKSFLISMQTPIVRVFVDKKEILFYDEREYTKYVKEYSDNYPTKKINKKNYKGLGTSSNKDINETFGVKLVEFKNDTNTTFNMNKVFHSTQSDARKEWLENYDPKNIALSWVGDKHEVIPLNISDFLNTETIKFSIADCKRSIPNIMDGFKESQRKTLYACFLRNLKYTGKSLKVAQLAGYIAEKTNYHHGEQNLYETITRMANDFVGSNNIPLLYRDGQFGSRSSGGKDAANARYIFTKLDALTRLLFKQEDDILLDKVEDDGDVVEPVFYVPIIPTVLINGINAAIGTGWSCSIPSYNPLDIIDSITTWIKEDGEIIIEDIEDENNVVSLLPEIHPWYRGFNGSIEKTDEFKYTSWGNITEEKKNKIVDELPIGMWTDNFKEYLDTLLEKKLLKKVKNYSTPKDVRFVLTEENDGIICNQDTLKLKKYISTSNMVLFTDKGTIKKYNSVDDIIDEFCKVRYEFYKKRKKYQLDHLEYEIKFLGNKRRFLEEVMNGTIKLFNDDTGEIRTSRKMSEIYTELQERGYDKEIKNNNDDDDEKDDEKGYNYLLSLQFRSITKEKINKLKNDIDSKLLDKDTLKAKSEKDIWLKELEELKSAYLKWLKDIEKLEKKKK
jgi:DNA topoisomerase-2